MFREAASILLRLTGIPLLVRETAQRNKVTIVVYHQLTPQIADVHFSALKRRYNVISLQHYIASRGQFRKGALPVKPLIVTIDDGFRSVYALMPVLKKHNIPVTVFICSSLVGTNRHFWFSHFEAGKLKELKLVADKARLAELSTMNFSETREYRTRQSLSNSEIEKMRHFVDFQSHTRLHPILPQCSLRRARTEIIESKRELEALLGLNIYALAYPNGDYTHREEAIVKKAGYKCALMLGNGFNSDRTNIFELRRIPMNDQSSTSELLLRVCGVWGALKNARARILDGEALFQKEESR